MYFDITNQVHEATLSAIKNPMIRECITYLDTHYREKINLEELANTLGYTKYYLSTCFKRKPVFLSLNTSWKNGLRMQN